MFYLLHCQTFSSYAELYSANVGKFILLCDMCLSPGYSRVRNGEI